MNGQVLRVEEQAAPYLVAPQLTDHLSTFAGAPEGFKRLRELVLNLAVRGRLAATQPTAWKHVCVSDICSVVTDGEHATPKRTHDSTAVPLVTAKNVRDGQMDYSNTDYVPADVAVKCWQRCKPEVGDVLMVSVGATLGRLSVLHDAKEMVLVRSVTLLRPITSLATSDYVALHLKSPTSQAEIWSVVRQSAQPCLYLGKTAALKIALPPLAEQSRIVAKVEELMALIDRLEAKAGASEAARGKLLDALLAVLADSPDAAATASAWAQLAPHFDLLLQTPANVDRLQQTLLTLAVKGRLVPQDPNDEPAAELLKRIRSEKERLVAEGKIKREKPLPPITAEEVPYELPIGWSWSRFGQVIDVETNLVAPADYADWPQIAPDLIEKGTGKLLGYRTVAEAEIKSPNHLFRAGLIIYSKIRPSLSKAVIAEFAGLCSADMYPLSVHINARYALHYILSWGFLEQVAVAENRVKMPKLNQEALTSFFFPLPPLAEQSRIAATVASLTALCDRLRERLAARRDIFAKFAAALTESAVN